MGPLDGVKVVEIAGIGPGPFAAMMMADMGADVVRVDRAANVMGGNPAAPPADVLNRGRRSIGIDLKSPDGVATLLDLIATADALVEGFRPGVAERLGFGPDVCLERNPRLVYGRMTGWGQDGTYAQAAARQAPASHRKLMTHWTPAAGKRPWDYWRWSARQTSPSRRRFVARRIAHSAQIATIAAPATNDGTSTAVVRYKNPARRIAMTYAIARPRVTPTTASPAPCAMTRALSRPTEAPRDRRIANSRSLSAMTATNTDNAPSVDSNTPTPASVAEPMAAARSELVNVRRKASSGMTSATAASGSMSCATRRTAGATAATDPVARTVRNADDNPRDMGYHAHGSGSDSRSLQRAVSTTPTTRRGAPSIGTSC